MSVCYCLNCRPFLSDRKINALLPSVSADRRAKVTGYLRLEDRARSLAAGLLIRYVELNTGDRVVFTQGRPLFAGPSARHLSLSHSGDYAVCAVSDRNVGADVEQIGDSLAGLEEQLFTDTERETLSRTEPADLEARRYRLWTLKESYLKALGTGLSRDPRSFSIATEGMIRVLDPERPAEDWCFAEYRDLSGYALSLCFAGRDPRVAVRDLRVRYVLPAGR